MSGLWDGMTFWVPEEQPDRPMTNAEIQAMIEETLALLATIAGGAE